MWQRGSFETIDKHEAKEDLGCSEWELEDQ